METPQAAILKLYDIGMDQQQIVDAIMQSESLLVQKSTICRVGLGENDPRYTTGAAIVKVAARILEDHERRMKRIRRGRPAVRA